MEMRIIVNILGLERLADAVLALAGSRAGTSPSGTSAAASTFTAAALAPVQTASAPAAGIPVSQPTTAVPTSSQAVPQPAASVPQQAVATAVPTTAVSYTLDDLARAGMSLMDMGRQADLQQLLARFSVEALPALPQAQYGAFATALREMGAQI